MASRFRLALSGTAALLGLMVLLLLVVQLPLGDLSHQPMNGSDASSLFAFLPFAVVGYVVGRRQPGNMIGWILLGVALFFLLSDAAGGYAAWDYRFHNGNLPLGVVAVFLQLRLGARDPPSPDARPAVSRRSAPFFSLEMGAVVLSSG
jgi:hypothetical protein